MNNFIKVLLSLSLSGSWLILILLVCRHLFQNKFSKQWQYYLWLIVIARLLLPFSPKISLIGTFMRQFETVKVQTISTETNTPNSFAISNASKPQTHFQHIMSEALW